jgi:MSHA biogenesis protein MshQ
MLRHLHVVLLAMLGLLPGTAVAASYGNSPEPFSWIDPAGHADAVWTGAPGAPAAECSGPSAPVDDDITQELPLGFTFDYGGTPYTSVRIMSNGRLQFNNSFCGYGTQSVGPPRTYPYPYPDSNLDRTLRVYGADLNPADGGSVRYAQLGTAPDRSFVVTWSNVPEWNAAGSFFNLQVILYENGDFVFQFGSSNNPSAGKAQIGWQLTTGDYDLISFPDIGSLASTAIRFSPPRPVAEYRLDEAGWDGTAGEVLDSSGNGIHGTARNGATPVPARVCNGAALDGASQYLEVADHPLLDINDELTVMAWIRPDVIPASGLKSIASKDENYEFHINSAGQIYWWWNNSSGNTRTLTTTGTALAAGNWYHIAVVYSRSGASQKIYINGTERASSTQAETLLTNADPFHIGADQGFSGREFDGLIDEVRIYNQALDENQINTAMNTTRTCPVSGPVRNLILSTESTETLGGLTFTDGSLAEYDALADTATLFFDEGNFTGNEDIDAVHLLSNGVIILSTTGNATLGGLTFRNGDLAAYDPATDTASLFFSEDLFSANENIDAVFVMDNGHLLLSTTGSAQLGGLSFRDGDIIEYDPLTNTATLYFSEDNFSGGADVDAVHLLDNGNLLISAMSTETLGGLTFTDGSVAEYDPVSDTASLYFDESRFSSGADINAITLSQPVVLLHHLQLEHDGTALTCEPENVTVKACANADCSSLFSSDVTVTLSPAGWVGGDTQIIRGGSGVFQLRHTTPETVTLGVVSSLPAAANPHQCLDTSSATASCDITFYDTGFVYTIPTQTSCATSAAITVAAVRKDDTTQQCVPSFSNRTENINFWTSYVNPGTGTNQVTLNNGSSDYLLDTATPGTVVPLAFDVNGETQITVTYPDAGQLSLNSEFNGTAG